MKTETTANKSYFSELALRLRQTGFVVLPEQDGFLPVEWNDQPLCRVASTGGIRYRQEDMTDSDTELACDRAADIAATVREYMTLLDKAPLLKADSLHEPYQVLAEFNDVVLAALPGKHGVQFTTWAWINERTSLWQGHYAGNDYQAAKRDFAIRSGLLDKHQLFSKEQLAEVIDTRNDMLKQRDDFKVTFLEWKSLYGGACDRVRRADDLVQRAQAELDSCIDQLKIVAFGLPAFDQIMADIFTTEKKE